MQATYIGPLEHLRGKTADVFVQEDGVHARFHETNLTLSGVLTAPLCCHPSWPLASLGFGLRIFPFEDFDIARPSA